jgi:hypothetical protein
LLPPVLEVYVVWHPADTEGRPIADEVIQHFHGTTFTGLIGGAVEVFVRSEGWRSGSDAPRPIPTPSAGPPNNLAQAQFMAVVPLLGNELAAAVEDGGEWRAFVRRITEAQQAAPDRVGVFPYRLHTPATQGTVLGALLGRYQAIAANVPQMPHDTPEGLRCRDLSQGLAQFLSGSPTRQLKAFISHTTQAASAEMGDVKALIALVRNVIGTTRLGEFIDANDLQPGTDWSQVLQDNAANSALLALRTDLYPTREWCQKEILVAKRSGMPIVILDGIGYTEQRGSFLMDHVPRAPIRTEGTEWKRRDVYRALNLLVDECLKRELWKQQQILGAHRTDLAVSWWAPHAPEPLTLIHWLENAKRGGSLPTGDSKLRILHPDPPLGPDERRVLDEMLAFAGMPGKLDVMTPRQLAGRGG